MRELALAAGGALSLLWGALYNGFPLVYNDTGTYLAGARTLQPPPDRPVFYGLFIRATQLAGSSLWWPVVAQALLVGWLVALTARAVRPGLTAARAAAVLAAVALGTAAPWFCGQLMADVFCGCLALSLFLLVFHWDSLRAWERPAVAGVYALCLLVHAAYAPIAAATLAALSFGVPRRRLAAPAALLALALFGGAAATRALRGEDRAAGATPAFLMARLLDSGLAVRLLDERCAAREYALCAYRDRLRGLGNPGYYWPDDSPFNRIGGWRYSRAATWPVVIDAAAYYPLADAASAARGLARQLASFGTGDGLWPYDAKSFLWQQVHEGYPAQLAALQGSRQQTGRLLGLVGALSRLHALVLLAALGAAGWALARRPRWAPPPARTLLAYALLFYAANALVCGLVLVTDRFGARAAWLVVLAAALCVAGGGAPEERVPARPSRWLLGTLAAAPACLLAVFLGARFLSGRFALTGPSPYHERPVVVWPKSDVVVLKTVPRAALAGVPGLAVGSRLATGAVVSGSEYQAVVCALDERTATLEVPWELVKW